MRTKPVAIVSRNYQLDVPKRFDTSFIGLGADHEADLAQPCLDGSESLVQPGRARAARILHVDDWDRLKPHSIAARIGRGSCSGSPSCLGACWRTARLRYRQA